MKPCSIFTSKENTVCYPQAELASKCPITFIDVVGEAEAKDASKRGEVDMIKLSNDMAIIFSKKKDSLPITSVKVEN